MSRLTYVLNERMTADILLYLAREGTSRKIDLYNAVSSNPRMPAKIGVLVNFGLVVMQHDRNMRSDILELTALGFEVAGALMDAETLMEEAAKP